MKKIIALALFASMIVLTTGCGDRLGVKTKYKASEKWYLTGYYITLYDGWGKSSGTGYAQDAYFEEDWFGSWCITGSFSYDSTSVKMTSGNKKDKKFSDKSQFKMSDDTTTLTVYGKKYKYGI
ncbi:MAG: hypothetical protein K5875_07245 [Saccharofermentans sp.]|nr:hypothetical protein [Saccharofermentans sp.]